MYFFKFIPLSTVHQTAYELETPFPKDGLLFYHKFGYYQVGLSPLVILWKDARTSRYLRVEVRC